MVTILEIHMRSLLKDMVMSAISLLFALSTLLFTTQAFAEVDTGWMTKQEHPPLKTRFVLTGQADAASKTVEGFLAVSYTHLTLPTRDDV